MAEVKRIDAVPDIVYLMGTGRSGTTILEILLTNSPELFGVGEVTHIFNDGFIRDVRCSCGVPARDCRIWSEVKRRCGWEDEGDARRDMLFRQHAWHSRFPMLALGLGSRAAREDYREVNRGLFSAIQALTAAKAVVDSSKYAGRALTLAGLFPGKVRVICVTRSPSGLINAFKKADAGEQRSKSLLATSLYYVYVMASLRITAWRLAGRILHVRYEDLASQPIEVLDRIGGFIGRDLSSTARKVSSNDWLQIGHIVTGNRMRFDGVTRFRPAVRQERLSSRRERLVARLLDGYRRLLGM